MTTLLAPLLATALLAAPPGEAGPPSPAPDEVTYTVPQGWVRSEKGRVVTLTPAGVSAERCSLVLTPGEKLDGDFGEWFGRRWDELRAGGKVVQGGSRTGRDGPRGNSFLHQAALLETKDADGTDKRVGLLLYAVHLGDVVHWVVFRTDGPALFNEHKKTVSEFLARMQFSRTKVEVSRPPPKQRPARPGDAKPPRAGEGSRS